MVRKHRVAEYADQKARRVRMACPQLIDPSIDYLAYAMLSSLELGRHAHTGAVRARDLLLCGARKPLALVVTTDAVTATVNDLRQMAVMLGVPVVHALPRMALGDAMRAACPLVVVAITDLPDDKTRDLLSLLMTRAASACGEFARRLAVATALPPCQPLLPAACQAFAPPEPLEHALRALVL